MMNNGLSRSEKWGIGISVALLVAVAAFYFSGASLKNLILGSMESQSQIQVGYVQVKKDVLRRSKSGAVEFEEIQEKAPLFGNDTVVTSDTGSATLVLEDGSLIELGPGAMVKLAFDADLSLAGVNRITEVEVVAGSVTGRGATTKVVIKSKSAGRVALVESRPVVVEEKEPVPPVAVAPPPKPVEEPKPVPPTPPAGVESSQVTEMNPSAGAHLRVPDGSVRAELPVKFSWNFSSGVDSQLMLRLKKGDQTVSEKLVGGTRGAGSWETVIQSPGSYTWTIELPDGKPLKDPAAAEFVVEPDFLGIALSPGKYNGKSVSDGRITNQISEVRSSEVSLVQEWSPFAGAEKYQVKLGSQTAETNKTIYQWKGKSLPAGGLPVSVSTKLSNGFVVRSNEIHYGLAFLAPKPSSPANQAQVAIQQGKVDLRRDGILLSWQQTNFTDSYEIEVAADATFKNNVVKRQSRANHSVFRGVRPGIYYWRVRAVKGSSRSDFSAIQQFTVTLN